jgi:tetratricopeptide (TPR) repeat protein
MTRGDFHLAVAYLKPLLLNELKLNDLRGALKTLSYLGQAYTKLGDHSTAIEYMEQSVTVTCDLGDPHDISDVLSDLGSAYAQSGQHDKALDLFEKALAVSNEIDDRLGAAKTLWNTSLSLDELNHRVAAIARAEEALRILEDAGSPEASMVQKQLGKWRRDND